VVLEVMQEPYPELASRREHVAVVLKGAEEGFRQTLERGSQILDDYLSDLRRRRATALDGEALFRLYDTFGLPVEAIESILAEEGFTADREGFEREMAAQRDRARRGTRMGDIFATEKGHAEQAALVLVKGVKPEFVGYERLEGEARVLELLDGENRPAEELGDGARGSVLLDATPFYGEAGGQVGDTGTIQAGEGIFLVEDTRKAQDIIIHVGRVTSGRLRKGEQCLARVDGARRQAIRRSHTATHLLHAGLRQVLGAYAQQSGSLVAPDRLRFDFTHPRQLTADELRDVELFVNARVVENQSVSAKQAALREALATGAIALFGEKYGEEVRLVEVGGGEGGVVSRELCGGTHCDRTGDVGAFLITGEEAVAAGIRRITAVTGPEAVRQWQEERDTVERVAAALEAPTARLRERAEEVMQALKEAKREAERLREDGIRRGLREAAESQVTPAAIDVGDTKVIRSTLSGVDERGLRIAVDELRRQHPSVAVAVGAVFGGQARVVLALSRDLVARGLSARKLIAGLAERLGGGGGGRDDLAQAGGPNADALKDALERFVEDARKALAG
jgi:alanyl-tRNA synthetase